MEHSGIVTPLHSTPLQSTPIQSNSSASRKKSHKNSKIGKPKIGKPYSKKVIKRGGNKKKGNKKPRQRQGFKLERFWESVLVSTPEERSHSSHLQKLIAKAAEAGAPWCGIATGTPWRTQLLKAWGARLEAEGLRLMGWWRGERPSPGRAVRAG